MFVGCWCSWGVGVREVLVFMRCWWCSCGVGVRGVLVFMGCWCSLVLCWVGVVLVLSWGVTPV